MDADGRRGKETGASLVEAAAALLDQGGDDAVTLRAVAAAVGVSHNAPYRHFADRAALLAAVAERDLRLLAAGLDGIREDGDPVRRVRSALDVFITHAEAHPARYRLLFGDPDIAARGGALEREAMALFIRLAEIVATAQDADRLPRVESAVLTGLLYAAIHGLLDLQRGGRLRPEKGLDDVRGGMSMLLDLLAPDARMR